MDEQKRLIRTFVEAFDRERWPTLEFRKAQSNALRGTGMRRLWGENEVHKACWNINKYLEERARFIWVKIQEVVTFTHLVITDSSANELKTEVRDYMQPIIEQAQIEFENIRQRGNVPTGWTMEAIAYGETMLVKIDAEIELFCAHLAMKQKDKTSTATTHITYNIHGSNARVNIGSEDYSINIDNSGAIFDEMRKAIESQISEESIKSAMLAKANELQSAVGKPNYMKTYSDFVALAANHMTVIGPFIPALTRLFS